MKIPFWDSTITLYRKITEPSGTVNWKRSVHDGCFWQRKTTRNRMDGAEFNLGYMICRIPKPYPDVRIGDIIVEGDVKDTIDEYAHGKRSSDLLIKYAERSMQVSDVHRNDRMAAAHLYAAG